MKVNITARHLELTPSLKEYAEKKLLKAKKYSKKITNAHIILNVEKNRHIAEIVIHISGQDISAKSVSGDMYGAVDLVMDKILKQLRRHMSRVKKRRDTLPYSVVADLAWEDMRNSSGSPKNLLGEEKEVELIEQSVFDAVKTLRDKDLTFWVFKEKESGEINIVYLKEEEDNYGIMKLKEKRGGIK
ncbi:MAG: ribosome hibernation-promoting factor, HPF/YfiA family [Elusimicrobiota bacterium]